MTFSDRVLTCIHCGDEFVFSAGEQAFFQDKKFTHEPKRCRKCKAKRSREPIVFKCDTHVTCAECGTETTVPFKPKQGRPVLCRSCFRQKSAEPAA